MRLNANLYPDSTALALSSLTLALLALLAGRVVLAVAVHLSGGGVQAAVGGVPVALAPPADGLGGGNSIDSLELERFLGGFLGNFVSSQIGCSNSSYRVIHTIRCRGLVEFDLLVPQ